MLSNQKVHQILDEIGANCFIALHFDNPHLAGAYASELSGAGYVRAKVAFSKASSRTIWSTSSATFSGLPAGRVAWLVGWNAQMKGDFQFAIEIPTPVNVLEGKGFNVPAGQIALSMAGYGAIPTRVG